MDRRREVPRRRAARDQGRRAVDVVVSMPPNPSHLEAVDPVVEGMARAAGTDRRCAAARRSFDPARSAADPDSRRRGVPGPGRRRRDAEPVPAARLSHRRHDPHHRQQPARVHDRRRTIRTARSYASGLARGFKIPIVHVNADDPEACVEAARLAFAYRARFQRDFLIDLIGYRRYGHNEGDEPAFTQPMMYQTDRARIRPCARSGRATLESSAASSQAGARRRAGQKQYTDELQRRSWTRCKPEQDFVEPQPETAAAGRGREGARPRCRSTRLREMNEALLRLPDGFHDSPEARTRPREAACTCSTIRTSARSTGRLPRSWRSRRSSPTASASA